MASTGTRAPARRAVDVRAIGCGVAAQAITIGILLGPLIDERWWGGFRAYFSNDQLSYSAIATNVARGDFRLVEPLTATGSLYYPSAWYQSIGIIARISGLSVELVWTLLGLAVACTAIGIAGWTAYRLSRRWFAPLLPGLLLLTGSLSTLAVGYWYTPINAHAVLWGAYGTLFTLNAENAALSLAVIALCLLLLASRSPRRATLVLVAAVIIGLLANVQTYAFFTSLSLVAFWAAVQGVATDRRRTRMWISLALITVVLVGGSALSGVVGPLPMFGLLLAALAPAATPVWIRNRRIATVAVALTVVAAAPQVIRTGLGLIGGDPFLTYRAASTKDLGVPLDMALFAALPLLLIGVACAPELARARIRPLITLLIAWPIGWLVMMTNDRWGFAQEPYRFWIQYVVIGTLLAGVVIAVASNRVRAISRPMRWISGALAALAVATWLVSLADLRGWWSFARAQGVISTSDARAEAIRSLVAERSGLFAAAPCVDPQVLKLIGADRVAHYNKGLAWPERVPDFEILQDPGRRTIADPVALRAAGVEFVVADSACPEQWAFAPRDQVTPIATAEYQVEGAQQAITLLKVLPR